MTLMSNYIVTDRLILRAPVLMDALVINRELAKWGTARMLATAPHPFPAQEPQTWWEERKHRMFPSRGLWRMLCLKGDKERTAIGNIAVMPDDKDNWSVGYWMSEDVWGMGYVTEALVAALEYVGETWRPGKITAGAFTDNPASRRVLEKAGFTMTGETTEWCEARKAHTPHWNFLLVR